MGNCERNCDVRADRSNSIYNCDRNNPIFEKRSLKEIDCDIYYGNRKNIAIFLLTLILARRTTLHFFEKKYRHVIACVFLQIGWNFSE